MEKVRIRAVREIEPETRYDLSVEKHNNFFANDILVHNCRLITSFDEAGVPTFFSRVGNEIETLGALIGELTGLGLEGMVLDGEICLIDENGKEDFQGIMKVIRKKDYTIPNPKYMVFDLLTKEEFIQKTTQVPFEFRQAMLNKTFMLYEGNKVEVLKQTKIENENHFNELVKEGREKGWEGLILRKNTAYKGKRSNDLLKVKDFLDAEYVVTGIVDGPFRIIEDGREITIETMASVTIEHKGNIVNVGSGFTIEQRKAFYAFPSLIIGRMITVQYFEETKNEKGGLSLRFPTVKYIYEGGRTT